MPANNSFRRKVSRVLGYWPAYRDSSRRAGDDDFVAGVADFLVVEDIQWGQCDDKMAPTVKQDFWQPLRRHPIPTQPLFAGVAVKQIPDSQATAARQGRAGSPRRRARGNRASEFRQNRRREIAEG